LLPNLDYFNLVNRVLVSHNIKNFLEGQHKASLLSQSIDLKGTYPIVGQVNKFLTDLYTMLFMMVNQASGIPSSAHGLFYR